jgi:hypothetical protein
MDKLDGIITAEMFDRHAGQWTLQMDQLNRAIEHQQAGSDRDYLPERRQLLELIKIIPTAAATRKTRTAQICHIELDLEGRHANCLLTSTV